MESINSRGHHRMKGKEAFIYEDHRDNHAIWPGREPYLVKFLRQSFKGMNHKKKPSISSNSEDAITWSCFDTLKIVSQERRGLGISVGILLPHIIRDDVDLRFLMREKKVSIGRRFSGVGTNKSCYLQ